MTVRLLAPWLDSRDGKRYVANNLLTTDAGTEAGLVVAKLADTNLAGGTAWVAPAVQAQRFNVVATETGALAKEDAAVPSPVSGGGAPIAISGTPAVGSTLTAAIAAGWQSSGGNWTRGGANISGATALAYLLVTADNGQAVTYKSSNIPYIPPAPTIGAATGGDGTASVAGTAPASTGGAAVDKYRAVPYIGSIAGTPVESVTLPVAVPGLVNGTAYTFRLQAHNSVGWGPESAASISVTPAAAPAGVEILTVDERGWPTSYRSAGVTYIIRTGPFGISTVESSAGRIDQYVYSSSGVLTGITTTGPANSVPSAITRNGQDVLTSFAIGGTTYTL